ncbi:MAG TPA: DUF3833 family protein [Caulobacter sp.]|nr:DUF3833 family protein [Caulobacter sp.]
MDGETFLHTRPFRPEVFFLGHTEGWGVARGVTGRVQRRCRIVTDGRLDEAYQAIHFDETVIWEGGETDEWRWAMTRGLNGAYVAAEAMAGAGIQGRYIGGDYLLSFHRPLRPDGGPRPRFQTRFTPISADVALKTVRISMFGLPVATMSAFHRRVA